MFPSDNETYEPSPPMPIVFGIRNPTLAAALNLKISWNIVEPPKPIDYNPPGYLDGTIQPVPDINRANPSPDSPPFFASHGTPALCGKESTWVLSCLPRQNTASRGAQFWGDWKEGWLALVLLGLFQSLVA